MGDGGEPGAHHRSRRVVLIRLPGYTLATAALTLFLGSAASFAPAQSPEKPFPLPFLGDAARERGIELPLPLGVGLVYYGLHRSIEVTDVRVGRNGAPPASVSQFVQFASKADVTNLTVMLRDSMDIGTTVAADLNGNVAITGVSQSCLIGSLSLSVNGNTAVASPPTRWPPASRTRTPSW